MIRYCFFSIALIFFSQQKSYANCAYEADSDIQKQMISCQNTPGKSWKCEMNRCLGTAEATEYNKRFSTCSEISEPSDRKICTDELSLEFVNTRGIEIIESVDDGNLGLAAKGLVGIQILHLIMAHTAAKSGASCAPMTMYKVAAISGVMNEVSNYFFIKDKTKDLKKEYDKEIVQTTGYNTQMRSFEYLAQHHDLIAETAKKKKISYLTTTGAYGVAAVIASMNAFKKPDPCQLNASYRPDNLFELLKHNNVQTMAMKGPSQSEVLYAKIIKTLINSLISDALAQTATNQFSPPPPNVSDPISSDAEGGNSMAGIMQTMSGPILGMAISGLGGSGGGQVGAMARGQGQKVKNSYLRSSMGIAVISGASATVSFMLYRHFNKIEKQATDNAYNIRELAKKFMVMSTNNCPDRTNPAYPECFCYNFNGTLNNTNSETLQCQNYLRSLLGDAVKSPNNYSPQTAITTYGCLNQKVEYDANCNCDKTNSCFKTGLTNFDQIGLLMGTDGYAKIADLQARGQTLGGNLSSVSTLAKQAFKNRALVRKSFEKLDAQLEKNKEAKLNLNTASSMKRVLNSVLPDSKLNSLPKLDFKNIGNLKKAQRITGLRDSVYKRPRKSLSAFNGSKNSNGFNSLRASTSPKAKVETFMNKSYDYSKGEIHKRSEQNIFEIISQRYRKSTKKLE